MTAEKIFNALRTESENLANQGNFGASEALIKFARIATESELIRFRQIMLSEPEPVDFWENITSVPAGSE